MTNSRLFPLTKQRVEKVIQVKELVKTYQTGTEPFEALHAVNFSVTANEYVGIIGKSGAGKTTLINMLSGVDQITSGEVYVNGTALHLLPEDQLPLWRSLNLGVVYQSFHLLPMLSLLDNISLAMDFSGTYQRGKSEIKAMELLDSVELANHARKLPTEISGGEKQRVAIARALANDPAVILADEPTGRLDSATAETIFKIFADLIKKGKTIVMVSHDRTLADRVDRVFNIVNGKIINNGGNTL